MAHELKKKLKNLSLIFNSVESQAHELKFKIFKLELELLS